MVFTNRFFNVGGFGVSRHASQPGVQILGEGVGRDRERIGCQEVSVQFVGVY